MYDLFFLSYEEPFAEANWESVKKRFPHAKRVHGVKGILEAHQACAKRSFTSHFYVVDADNEIVQRFQFDHRVPEYDREYVHLWYARNPVNRLEYGWGGLKLFPKHLVLGASSMTLDLTTQFPLKIIPKVATVTHFNKSPFDAWRSAFRECAKLTKAEFKNSDPTETAMRLLAWKTIGAEAKNGEYVIAGANAGAEFAKATDDITSINDWDWLKTQFKQQYPDGTVE